MITVFTPTYNRAHLLPRLYESLCRQTCTDFEWIIVDDGSTDNTEELVRSFVSEGKLDIIYVRQANGGKHRAINQGVQLAHGDLTFIADSDDWLTDDALAAVLEVWSEVSHDEHIAGVCGLDCTPDGAVVGSGFPKPVIDANAVDIRLRYGVKGDLKEVFRTDVLREFAFPEIPGERFCPEALVWNRIAQKYCLRYFNRAIYVADYQDGGLTDRITRIRMLSPVASMMTYAEMLGMKIPLKQKVKAAINYWRFAFCAEHRSVKAPLWTWLVMPVGYAMHRRDKRNNGSNP